MKLTRSTGWEERRATEVVCREGTLGCFYFSLFHSHKKEASSYLPKAKYLGWEWERDFKRAMDTMMIFDSSLKEQCREPILLYTFQIFSLRLLFLFPGFEIIHVLVVECWWFNQWVWFRKGKEVSFLRYRVYFCSVSISHTHMWKMDLTQSFVMLLYCVRYIRALWLPCSYFRKVQMPRLCSFWHIHPKIANILYVFISNL